MGGLYLYTRASGVSIFEWLLNRPPIIRQKRTYFIICSDPKVTRPEDRHGQCKIKLCYGLYALKRMGWACPTETRYVKTRGRHRFSFKRVEYPHNTEWFAIPNPIPPNPKKPNQTPDEVLYETYMDMFKQFRKFNWRTEKGTKEGVKAMEKRFGGGMLVETPTVWTDWDDDKDGEGEGEAEAEGSDDGVGDGRGNGKP